MYKKHKFLVLVDCQNDFITGSLAVNNAVEKMEYVVNYIKDNYTRNDYSGIICTHDSHPIEHFSFKENGGQWPVHCVKNTDGCKLYEPVSSLIETIDTPILHIYKGEDKDIEEYSGFSSELHLNELKKFFYRINDITNIEKCGKNLVFDVCGIAGDYCVKESIKGLSDTFKLATINIIEDGIAYIDEVNGKNELKNIIFQHNNNRKNYLLHTPIVTHFTDTDFYTFTCQYFTMVNFPRTEIEYTFFDRNNTKYPAEIVTLLRNQLNYLNILTITEEEINFMKSKINFLPDWYYTYLRGFRFKSEQVNIWLDKDEHLCIKVKGPWHEAIVWEMPILCCVSELMHILNDDIDKYDYNFEMKRIEEITEKALKNGIKFADMGTRRRFSKEHHYDVINAIYRTATKFEGDEEYPGKFNGSSNVYMCMQYDLTPIGTMSHQCISMVEGLMSSPLEANYTMMKMWNDTFKGNCGIYLYDCFGDTLFFNNFGMQSALMYNGLRCDSGDEFEQTDKIHSAYLKYGINPLTKSVVYSNGLNIDKAIKINEYAKNKVNPSFGIGTFLTGTVKDTKHSNIVLKATAGRITETSKWVPIVKLSCDKGKTVGNKQKCEYIQNLIDSIS